MHTCAELIASVPFLEDAEENFVRYLVTQLHPTVCITPPAQAVITACQCLVITGTTVSSLVSECMSNE